MGKKYIIEIEDDRNIIQTFGGKYTLAVSTRLGNVEGFIDTAIPVMPYTEPDLEQVRKEAYEDGYKTAKVQCNIQAEKDMREVGERHYQRGLSDAWEASRKVVALSTVDRRNVFGSEYMYSILEKHTASEAIEKIQQYEQEKEEIKVGDEVYVEKLKGKAVVMQAGKIMCCTFQNGDTFTPHMEDCKKTGRHFPEIAEVLQKMREE